LVTATATCRRSCWLSGAAVLELLLLGVLSAAPSARLLLLPVLLVLLWRGSACRGRTTSLHNKKIPVLCQTVYDVIAWCAADRVLPTKPFKALPCTSSTTLVHGILVANWSTVVTATVTVTVMTPDMTYSMFATCIGNA